MAMTSVEEFVSTPEGMRLYQQERAIESVTGLICTLMENEGVSRTELAGRLGMTPGRITQLLDGESNKTVRTLSDMFSALGHSLNFVAGSLDICEVVPGIDTAPAKSIQHLLEVLTCKMSVTSAPPIDLPCPKGKSAMQPVVFSQSQFTIRGWEEDAPSVGEVLFPAGQFQLATTSKCG